MKGDKMAKKSSFGSIVKKKLCDITNALPTSKTPNNSEKANSPNSAVKDYIDNLVKENLALVKIIEDKNKIIELSGLELQKLRINFQKIQLQNWSLAQSNCHMSAELKLGKEKLKSLQHELVCKDALLKAKNMELKKQEKLSGQNNEPQEEEAREETTESNHGSSKSCKRNKRRPIRTMGHSSTSQKVAETENKRRCIRQSASLQVQAPAEILFEIEDAKFSTGKGKPLYSPMHKDGKAGKLICTEAQRKSIGRPSRKAVEKVLSYREIPINIKMRRLE